MEVRLNSVNQYGPVVRSDVGGYKEVCVLKRLHF